MLKLSCIITGEDYSLLRNETPKSKKKVNALATSIFIPVLMWFVNAFLLMFYILDSTIIGSILTAFFCGLLIFFVERLIAMTKGGLANGTRILLGLVISTLGAISIDEVVFKEDIDQQMEENKANLVNSKKLEVDSVFQADFNRHSNEKIEKYTTWMNALDIAQKEADGTGGSGKKGVHGITKLKLQLAAYSAYIEHPIPF